MLLSTQLLSWKRLLRAAVTAMILCQAAGAAERTLERQLAKYSTHILQELRQRSSTSVGVLKFQVQKPGKKPTDNAGTFNTFLADRLEAALVLATDHNSDLRIVRNASRVAASIEGASHLSTSGRARLYEATYLAAWGGDEIKGHTFLTGVAKFAPDYKSFRLGIRAVEPGASTLKFLIQFEVDADGEILHEIGESFQLRGVPQAGIVPDATSQIRQVQQLPESHYPLRDDPSIQLLIFYDEQPVTLEFRQGTAWIPEPREGQAVTFHLERLDAGRGALGAVLKINGENTLYRERQRDFICAKWIFPDRRAYKVRGFQMRDNATMEKFRVASRAESHDLEMQYGPDVGTISLVAFREAEQVDDTIDVLGAEAADVLAIASAKFPKNTPPDAETLKSWLREPPVDDQHQPAGQASAAEVDLQTKGLVAAGEEQRHRVVVQDRMWDPEPVLSAVIRYYQPSE